MTAFRNVLCGVDLSGADARVDGDPLSPAGAAALSTATLLARASAGRLHLLAALDLDAAAHSVLLAERGGGEATLDERAARRLSTLALGVRALGVPTTVEVTLGAPAASLLDDASRHGRDLVVVGTRERGELARNLLGSTALRLVRRSPAPVWIAREAFGAKPARVLAAIDLGDVAPLVLAAAAAAADAAGGELHVLHVVDYAAEDVLRAGAADAAFVEEYRRRRRERAETGVPALVARACGARTVRLHFREGAVHPAIDGAADELAADVVVLGSVVHSGLGAAFTGLGRTAEHVLAHVRRSLLVVKPQPAG